MAGALFQNPAGALTGDGRRCADSLLHDVQVLSERIGERNTGCPDSLQKAAEYIEQVLSQWDYTVRRETYVADGTEVSNIIAERIGATRPEEIVIVGAHYDSVPGSPGADDNASGVAVLLELAFRFKGVQTGRTVRFVAFVNEEMPFFQTGSMGSQVHAMGCTQRGEQIVAMLCLESVGYFENAPGSQQYPEALAGMYPDTGTFIAFCSNPASSELFQQCIDTFRRTERLSSEGIVAPEYLVEGIAWSDHRSFWEQGYPALMITDTAFYRNWRYHQPSDTWDTLDYEAMGRLADGLAEVLGELIAAVPSC